MNTLFPLPVIPEAYKVNPMCRATGITEGKKCKTCKHLLVKQYSKKYYKCAFRGNTNGPGTDHRVNWPACGKYEPDDRMPVASESVTTVEKLKPGMWFRYDNQRKFRRCVRVVPVPADSPVEDHHGKLIVICEDCRQVILSPHHAIITSSGDGAQNQ